MVDAHGENRIAVAGGANTALTSVQVRAALKRLALDGRRRRARRARDPDRGHARGAAPGQDRRGDHDPQSRPRRPASAVRRSTWPTSSPRTRASWRSSSDPRARRPSPDGGCSAPSPGAAPRWSASVVAGRCSWRAGGRARSAPRGSTPSTRSAPAMRSTARWRPVWRRVSTCAEAARRAVVAASLAVTRAGAREGMPTAGELEVALARGTR